MGEVIYVKRWRNIQSRSGKKSIGEIISIARCRLKFLVKRIIYLPWEIPTKRLIAVALNCLEKAQSDDLGRRWVNLTVHDLSVKERIFLHVCLVKDGGIFVYTKKLFGPDKFRGFQIPSIVAVAEGTRIEYLKKIKPAVISRMAKKLTTAEPVLPGGESWASRLAPYSF